MKLLKNVGLLLMSGLLLFSACKKDDDNDTGGFTKTTTEVSTVIPQVLITASVGGTVLDEAGDPLSLATVNVGMNTTETDDFGVFSFTNISMNKNGTLVTVEKDGYYKNSKVVMAQANSIAETKMLLIEKVITTTFSANDGGTAVTNGGAKVDIPANGIKTASGAAYTGNVNVYATWLDPTAPDLSLRMPGDLRGEDADENAVTLVSFGMIGVELEADNGDPLNIAEGQTATIEIPIPASLLNNAPATIPLWHFDEATGFWMEEGEATLTNNKYVGTVSHFSFWNCDAPFDLVQIEGTVTNEGQSNLGGLSVEISITDNGWETGYAYTDENGWFGGLIPKDENLTIKIFDACGAGIYIGAIGPFSEDAVLPTIVIESSNTNTITITGVLQDCDNNIEDDGYAQLIFDNGYYSDYLYSDNNGNINGTISVCDALSVSVSGVSWDPFSQGTTTVHDIQGVTELDLGTLTTCW